MGIVNVTPDSFSDGGQFQTSKDAVDYGISLAAAGADLVDVGGESTRPGAQRVPGAAEQDRVIPVIQGLVAAGVAVSIDTMRAATATAAATAGAILINDVSGGLADERMYAAVAEVGLPYVVMHWRAHSTEMNDWTAYPGGVVSDVTTELHQRIQAATVAGIAPQKIVIDPGLGFAKDTAHNWSLLAGLPTLIDLGYPVLVGASRKRFIGELLATDAGPRNVAQREDATAAISAHVAALGAWCVRVHDVAATSDAVRVVAAITNASTALGLAEGEL